MEIVKCCKCNKYAHKVSKGGACIFCASSEVDNIYIIESNNKEALRYYRKGYEYLVNNKYDAAIENFRMALRFDMECSEAYWMGYLALNEVSGDDELIYSGKFDKDSSQVRNAVKYGDENTCKIYKEIMEIDNLLKTQLKKNNETINREKICDIVANSNCNKIIDEIRAEYKKIKECQFSLIKSQHKQINFEWEIRQKYANVEYAQLKLCEKLIGKFMCKGYVELAKDDDDILSLSAIEKYQNSINVNDIENKCKACSEREEVRSEMATQLGIIEIIKEHNIRLKKLKDILNGYFNEVRVVEKNDFNSVLFDEEKLYAGIDKSLPLLETYSMLVNVVK